ncbi:beta-lactamase [Paenibacillus mucilaginosus K02]|uniref:Beta-lactamase n=2 Tax=Paenibacillus mucilaginosus TaxID=61624 RepID=I0BSI6_9BACL|nr:beta-lactamase [Paenibacillus mucilaginosus K02]
MEMKIEMEIRGGTKMMRKRMVLTVIVLLFGAAVQAAAAKDKGETGEAGRPLPVKKIQAEQAFEGRTGTFVIKDLHSGDTYVYNRERAETPFTPESTFKVANALIGLQNGAVRDEYDVKRWDGTIREFESWNRDHTLGSAMRESAIWYYQALARDIGAEHMQQGLDSLSYGNRDLSGGIDRFWLDSTLKITAMEQVDFLEKLVREQLPLDRPVMKTVKRMMIQEEGDTYTLYGKTGTRLSDYGLGWYVGFLTGEKRSYVFAANLEGSGTEAKAAVTGILKSHGLLPLQ